MKSLEEPIHNARVRIAELRAEARSLEIWIDACTKICDHEYVDAPDLYDYHKREDFSRCRICGDVR